MNRELCERRANAAVNTFGCAPMPNDGSSGGRDGGDEPAEVDDRMRTWRRLACQLRWSLWGRCAGSGWHQGACRGPPARPGGTSRSHGSLGGLGIGAVHLRRGHPGQDRPLGDGSWVIGERWSARSLELRDLLTRHRVPVGFYDAASEHGRQLRHELGLQSPELPVVEILFGVEQATLVNPPTRRSLTPSASRRRCAPSRSSTWR